jgi:hypothetical protein
MSQSNTLIYGGVVKEEEFDYGMGISVSKILRSQFFHS